ncbi:MAG: RagB/SusD family nutrient uptake outer membrane protein [Breznakibacter sp.]
MKRLYNIKLFSVRTAVAILPLTGIAVSCSSDFLEITPELTIPDENTFDTPERILAQVNGLYASAKHGRLFGGRYYIYNDIRGEEFRNRASNTVTGYSAYQFTNNASDTYVADFWNYGYLTINRVNKFLSDFDAHPGVVDDETEENYRAEAKFIRALSYYALVQLFAKPYIYQNGASKAIPLRLSAETSSENNELESSTVAQIYTQILKDLDEAETGLPETYSSAYLYTTRAHKNTAIALKTRVYLAKGDYGKVIEEANKIVPAVAPFKSATGVAHELQADITSVFKTPYTTVESILSFPFADTNVPGTQNQLGYYYNAGNIEYYLVTSGAGIYADSRWGANDARKTGLTDLKSVGTSTTKYRVLTKWSGSSPYLDYAPVIRYAEILLNLAEAEAEAEDGDLDRSRALLEAVRHRSDATYDFGTLDKDGLIEAILLERRIELLGEGFRAPDAQRRGVAINSYGAGALIPVTDGRYTFPIPVAEQQTNPGSAQ